MLNTSYIKLENLIEIRKNNHFKQKDIANLLGYDRSYYGKIENGLYELKFQDALKLCLLFNCEVLYIYNVKRNYQPLSDEDRILIENFLKSDPGKF